MSTFTVTNGTHPRTQSISHYPEEIDQVFLDIDTWFKTHASGLSIEKCGGADSGDLKDLRAAFEDFPSTLVTLLKMHDGGIYFGEYEMLGAQSMLKTSKASSKASAEWSKDWIPIAADVDENLLIIDSKGKVREWDPDGERVEKGSLGSSFATYLETYRDKLCSGHMEFIEDVGCVETCVTPARHAGSSSKLDDDEEPKSSKLDDDDDGDDGRRSMK